MSRINTNIPSMVAARILNSQNEKLNTSLNRLSTGLRIIKGGDDPAGLIASEALRSEQVAIKAAITNISRANNVIAVAESGLEEVNKLLTELEDLIDRSANEAAITSSERDANQLQIDAILDSINRIANSTEFQGRKLLSGELDYDLSGVSTANFDNVSITSARVPDGGTRTVVIQVTSTAQVAQLTYGASATGAGTTSLEVAGNLGTESLSFASTTGIATVATAVNESTGMTGVSAIASSNDSLYFVSAQYGSEQFVSVRALAGTFAVTGGDAGETKDKGRNATVLVNGSLATTQGLLASSRSTVLSLDFDMTSAFGTALGTTTFYVTGGGADFMISPTVNLSGQTSLGIQSVSTGSLGNQAVGFLSTLASGQTNALSTGNYAAAQRILRVGEGTVAFLRGRLGAFQKDTLQPTARSLEITLENTTAAESAIRDTDFASETSNLTKAQILVQSATSVLRIANAAPQAVLSLLA